MRVSALRFYSCGWHCIISGLHRSIACAAALDRTRRVTFRPEASLVRLWPRARPSGYGTTRSARGSNALSKSLIALPWLTVAVHIHAVHTPPQPWTWLHRRPPCAGPWLEVGLVCHEKRGLGSVSAARA